MVAWWASQIRSDEGLAGLSQLRASPKRTLKSSTSVRTVLFERSLSSNTVPHRSVDASGRPFSRKLETNKGELCRSPDIRLANPKSPRILFLTGWQNAAAIFFALWRKVASIWRNHYWLTFFFLQVLHLFFFFKCPQWRKLIKMAEVH